MARSKPFLRKAGEKRLGRFRAALEAATRSPGEEAVHDLRVSIRRLLAFLHLAESLTGAEAPFPRTLFDTLETLMRPLGRLRDAHVKALRLRALSPSADRVTWLYALAVRSDIEKWEAGVLKSLKGARRIDFPEALRALPLSPSPADTLGTNAMSLLRRREAEVIRLSGSFLRLRSPESLHELRLGFKGYRYTAEALASLLPGLTEETGARLHDFQTLLGNIHDYDLMLQSLRHFRAMVLGLPPAENRITINLESARTRDLDSLKSVLQSGNGIKGLFAPRGAAGRPERRSNVV